MNTLTQLMQYFGYASAFAFVAPAIVLCSIARLGLAKGAPNIVPDIITHGLLLIALGAGLFFQVTLARPAARIPSGCTSTALRSSSARCSAPYIS